MVKGQDSIVGRQMKRKAKKSLENKRRQKLREQAKGQTFEFADKITTDEPGV